MTSDDVQSVLSSRAGVQFSDRLLCDVSILSTTTWVQRGLSGVYRSTVNLSDTWHSPLRAIASLHLEDVYVAF